MLALCMLISTPSSLQSLLSGAAISGPMPQNALHWPATSHMGAAGTCLTTSKSTAPLNLKTIATVSNDS